MSNLITELAHNDVFTFLCGAVSILGFIMTVFVTWKTDSIQKILRGNRLIDDFNEKRGDYHGSLKGYRDALKDALDEGLDARKIKANIEDDINTIWYHYKTLLSLAQRIRMRALVNELRKDETNMQRVINMLSDIIVVFDKDKEKENG